MNPEKGYNMTSGGNQQNVVKMSPEACKKISVSRTGHLNTTRRANTQEEDRPIVEAFKSGKSRKQIVIDLGVTGAKVQKALARWKKRVEPDLAVGPEHQYTNSGQSLQRNALERNQRMIDMVTKEGKTRKQTAEELGVTYALVKNVLFRHRRRTLNSNVDGE